MAKDNGFGDSLDSVVKFTLTGDGKIAKRNNGYSRIEHYGIDASAKSTGIERLGKKFTKFLTANDWEESRAAIFYFGVQEAVINAIMHAYNRQEGKKVDVYVKLFNDPSSGAYAEASVISKDGKPLEEQTVRESLERANNTPVTDMAGSIEDNGKKPGLGWGFHNMTLYCDEVDIELRDDYTKIILRKSKIPLEETVTIQKK